MAGRMSVAEKVEIWRLVRAGVSFRIIGRQLGRSDASIRQYVGLTGGIRPRERTRAAVCLSAREREEISRGLAAGESLRCIAGRLDRAPSTVSREVARNGGHRRYRAAASDRAAWVRASRPKRCKLASNRRLQRLVAGKLGQDWSPEQIAGWLVRTFPDEPEMRVSHETIYLTLFVQARGALKRELATHLRTRRMMRRSQAHTSHGHGRGQIVDAVTISERPAEVEDRAVPGHWEGDLLLGSGLSQIATLVERSTRFVMLVQLPKGRSTEHVVGALTTHVRSLPDQLRRSLTWDRGHELADHKRFTVDTGVQVFFCDPKSPWQRGSNENTNGLLRQYFPKGTSVAGFTQEQLDEVAAKLNGRPRQTHGWMTPSEKLDEVLR
jgi:IS30 family transposase